MLIPIKYLRLCWGVQANGVLHVGAHEAEELEGYETAGWGPVIWVEGLPDKAAALEKRFAGSPVHTLIQAVVWDVDGVSLEMRRASNGQSSSVFDFGDMLTEYPEIEITEHLTLVSSRLDTLLSNVAQGFDFVNVDVQGAELHAIKGLGDRLNQVRWIYVEITTAPLYEGAPMVDEIDAYLAPLGFRRVDTVMNSQGWGDALYLRNGTIRFRSLRHFSRRVLQRVSERITS